MRPAIRWRRKVCTAALQIAEWGFKGYNGLTGCVCALAVRQLSELLAQVKDEQSYIVVRERTHRNTAESTNGRVKWWSIFQLGVLIGEGVFQVWWLKRFFEVSGSIGGGEWRAVLIWVIGQACGLEVMEDWETHRKPELLGRGMRNAAGVDYVVVEGRAFSSYLLLRPACSPVRGMCEIVFIVRPLISSCEITICVCELHTSGPLRQAVRVFVQKTQSELRNHESEFLCTLIQQLEVFILYNVAYYCA